MNTEWLVKCGNGDEVVIEAESSGMAYVMARQIADDRNTMLVGFWIQKGSNK